MFPKQQHGNGNGMAVLFWTPPGTDKRPWFGTDACCDLLTLPLVEYNVPLVHQLWRIISKFAIFFVFIICIAVLAGLKNLVWVRGAVTDVVRSFALEWLLNLVFKFTISFIYTFFQCNIVIIYEKHT
jgi:hypothetical protein